MSIIRAFVAIDIPIEIRNQIKEIQENLPEFKGKLTEPENLHLTLKFLGEIPESKLEEIKKRLRKIEFKKFETEINTIGSFDNMKSNKYERQLVVWLYMANCDALQREVDNVLTGLFEKEKRFMPHLTIARIKNVSNKKEFLEQIGKIRFNKLKFKGDQFKLKQSILTKSGSFYKDLEVYNLG